MNHIVVPEGSGFVAHTARRIIFDVKELSSSLKTPAPTQLELNVTSDYASKLWT